MEVLLGEETLKRLLMSLNTPKKWRTMDPVEIAENLRVLCDHFPRNEVARRLGISEKGTLWVYLRLLDLPKKVQELVKGKKIGKDAAYRISILKDKREQETLADAVIKHRLTTNELKGIVQALKKRNPDMPIEQAISLALKARPRISEEHIVVTKIEDDTLEALKNKSDKTRVPVQELVKRSLTEILPLSSLTSLKLVGQMVFLSLNEEDFKILGKKAREKKIKLENMIDTLARKEAFA
ncbi:hypothetical protein E3J74_09370 [Candidatus Bathyarchaeota archaeon]|nr:MAG: hypothetical protein E3J74_09370 [Candidatus Bathyarchaeota archaeon]